MGRSQIFHWSTYVGFKYIRKILPYGFDRARPPRIIVSKSWALRVRNTFYSDYTVFTKSSSLSQNDHFAGNRARTQEALSRAFASKNARENAA